MGLLTLAACGGGDGGSAGTSSSPSTSGASSGTPAPAEDAYILYREASGNIVAQNQKTGARYHQEVDFTNEVIVGVQCTRDGSKIAYLIQVFTESVRKVDIHGADAPAEPLLLPTTTQGTAWSPDGTKLAVSDYDGFAETHTISILDITTGDLTQIDSGPDFVGSLSWSPDGTTLAYYFQSVTGDTAQIYRLAVDGGEPKAITTGPIAWYDPVWSADGAKILVAGLEEENFQLYELDPAGGAEPKQITDSDIFKRGPAYSPSGNYIAYTGSIVTPSLAAWGAALHSFGIFLTNADGTNEHAFTADPRLNPGAQVDPYLDAYLLGWCPTGPWLDDLWVAEQ
jgi:Tol biopolymer transport system component